MSDLEFSGVTAHALANLYFDGKVVSHTIVLPDGNKKTLGVIFPGDYSFNTAAAEEMAISAGRVRVRLAGEGEFRSVSAGQSFHVPEKSSFEVSVDEGVAQYVCHYG